MGIRAQPAPLTLTPDEPLTVRLDGVRPAILHYDAVPGETITITARALDDIDTTLELLTPSDRRLAFNDNHPGVDDPPLAPTDSALLHVPLTKGGRYTLRVDSFSGVAVGEVVVTLNVVAPVPERVIAQNDRETRLLIALPPGRVYRRTLETATDADETVTLTARDPFGRLDSLLTLRDADGALVAFNDDHASDDLTLNLFDARLSGVRLVAGAPFTLELREFLGRGGILHLTITRERP